VVVRSSQAELLERARASFAAVERHPPLPRTPLTLAVAGAAGTPLTLTATADHETVTVESAIRLARRGSIPSMTPGCASSSAGWARLPLCSARWIWRGSRTGSSCR
jgi:hypothetical protein